MKSTPCLMCWFQPQCLLLNYPVPPTCQKLYIFISCVNSRIWKMLAFRDVIDVPFVVRRLHRAHKEVRKDLGIEDDVKLVIFNFGGQSCKNCERKSENKCCSPFTI